MTKSRIKSSTTLIVVLSVLLVLSLAATVTLAYFSATKQLTGTLNFAGNVQLNAYTNGSSSPASVWTVNGGATADASNITTDQSLDSIAVDASGAGTLNYYIAIKVVTSGTGAPTAANMYAGSGEDDTEIVASQTYYWVALSSSGYTGWMVLSSVEGTATPVAVAANTKVNCTIATDVLAASAQGNTVTANFYAVAVTSDSTNAVTDLQTAITGAGWAA